MISPPAASTAAHVRYRIPKRTLLRLARAMLGQGRTTLLADAQDLLAGVQPAPQIVGEENLPAEGSFCIVANHYERRGLWIGFPSALLVCAVARRRPGSPLHFGVVAETRLWRGRIPVPGTAWAYRRVADCYAMVPLPAHPRDVRGRALALRRLARLALPPPDGRGEPIAFYPEGESGTSESLSEPLPGSGRFLAALARRGVPLLPVAFSERNGRLTATIGTAFVPSALQQGTAAEGSLDAAVAREAMARVASLMPRGRSDVVAEGLFRTGAAGRLRPSLGRWGRAQRLLPPPPARVLDCGCAFGYLTKELVRRYETYGIDLDPGYVTRARRAAPDADIRLGSASALPWEDSFFDAVVCLDVLEHCPDPRAVVTEMGRVLRPGGTLVLSVPHRGVLSWADSLNVYSRLLPKRDVPTDDPSWRERPFHAHFSARALAELLGPHFQVDRVLRTGIGVAEPINLGLLLATRGISRRLRPVYAVLQYLYFAAYIVEDMLPSGPAGYHLMVRARRMAEPTP